MEGVGRGSADSERTVPPSVEGHPLSSQQRIAWELAGGGAAFREGLCLELSGRLDTHLLRRAAQEVVRRTEILQTTFARLPGMRFPLQRRSDLLSASWREVDLGGLAPGERDARVDRLIAERMRGVFDPEVDPALHVLLARCSAHSHQVMVDIDPLRGDARSLELVAERILRECGRLAGDDAVVDEDVPFVRFVAWERAELEGPDAEAGRAFWGGLEPSPPRAWYLQGGRESARGQRPTRFAADLSTTPAELAAASDELGASPERVALAIWHALVGRLSRGRQKVVHALLNGRELPELESAIGPYARLVPVAGAAEDVRSFHDAVRCVDAAANQAWNWQLYYDGRASAAPGSAVLAFQWDAWQPPALLWGRRSPPLRVGFRRRYPYGQRCDLKLVVRQDSRRLEAELLAPGACSRDRLAQLHGGFDRLLRAASLDPDTSIDRVGILAPEQRRALVDLGGAQACESARSCFTRSFEECAARNPDAIAVVYGGEHLSYAALDRRARALAASLQALGVGREDAVGIFLERSVDLVVAILGVLEAGAAYVPLDPAHPTAYLEQIAQESGVQLVVASATEGCPIRGARPVPLRDCGRDEPPVLRRSAAGYRDLAYVIFTSGTSGRPNGVQVEQRALVDLWHRLRERIYAGTTGRLHASLNASFAFDASVKQLVLLLGGHTLHVLPREIRADGAEFVARLACQPLDVLDSTPSQLRELVESGLLESEAAAPQLGLVGGEPIEPALWSRLGDGATRWFNVYGPTECTVDATAARIEPTAEGPGIGSALQGVEAHVLDSRLDPVPLGAVGELHLAGTGVARGYASNPALTAERFLPCPFASRPGERMYATGDFARRREDGSLELLDRPDRQLKVRGHRVEAGHIEAVLTQHPGVESAHVVLRERKDGGRVLVAYVVPVERGSVALAGMRHARLPDGRPIAHLNKHETDYLIDEIFRSRTYQRHGFELRDGDCVFDVGANIGLASLFFHLQARDVRIYAFEPVPELCEIARANFAAHGIRGKVFECALGARSGASEISYYPTYSIMSSLHADPVDEENTVRTYIRNQRRLGGLSDASDGLLEQLDEFLEGRFAPEPVSIRLQTLSDAIASESVEVIDLLKIDVQKSELDVLAGVRPEDWPRIRRIAMEVHDLGSALSEAVERLRRAGFEVRVEQDDVLEGTNRFHVYAAREPFGPAPVRASAARASPAGRIGLPPLLVASELRELAATRLPEFMRPGRYELIESVPLNANGKIDLAALPEPSRRGADAEAPETQLERILASLWAQILSLESVAADDNFFELGGDSMLQIRVVARANELGVAIRPLHLVRFPTPRSLARAAEREGLVRGAGAGNGEAGGPPSVSIELPPEELADLLQRVRGDARSG